MSKFVEIGVEKQYSASTIHQATTRYEQSCYLCCIRGRHADCKFCNIDYAHKEIIDYFHSMAAIKTA